MATHQPSQQDLAILCAPLRLSAPRWTSQDVAALIGVSQSAVARTWARVYHESAIGANLPGELALIGVHVDHGQQLLVARTHPAGPPQPLATSHLGAMRSPRRIPYQTLLAAPLAQRPSNDDLALPATVVSAAASPGAGAIGTGPRPVALPPSCGYTHVPLAQWQGLLPYLVRAAHRTDAGSLRNLHQELIVWGADPSRPFSWVAAPQLDKPRPPTQRSSALKSTQQVVADQVFELIVALIWDGALTAGDRITESALARHLHTTRNQTRDALRALASAGLVDYHPVRGVLVPAPTRKDVADIYSARRALGTEIIRRVIENAKHDVSGLEAALAAVVSSAATGNSYETGNADLAFQDAIADHSGMRNIPQMFGVLAKQLRIYIAVMGLSYFYDIDAMVRDDTTLLRHITARDLDGATRAWHAKVNDAVTYMTTQVTRYR